MDGSLALGLALAGASAACYDTGYALQAIEARRAPTAHALSPKLLVHLLRRPLWLGATTLSLAGWPIQIAALTLAPLTLVQPALALGLILLLVLGRRILHEPVGAREYLSVAVIIAAVAVVAWAAPGETGDVTRGPGLTVAIAGLVLATGVPYVLRIGGRHLPPALLLITAAGAADGLAAFVAKLIAEDAEAGRIGAVAAWAALAGAAVVAGLISESSALQRVAATRVAPAVLAMQILIPVALAPTVGGEGWGSTPGGGAILVAALLALGVGVLGLGSSPAVAGMVADQPAGEG